MVAGLIYFTEYIWIAQDDDQVMPSPKPTAPLFFFIQVLLKSLCMHDGTEEREA